MPTPASGDAAYCTVARLKSTCDVRALCQFASDSNVPVQESSLDSNQKVLDLLGEASGFVESVATVGKAYVIDPNATPPRNDLAALTGNSAQLLAGMVAAIATWLLFTRRPAFFGNKMPPVCEMYVEKWLPELQAGKKVFGILENQASGLMSHAVETARDVEGRNMLTLEAARLFGRRNNRLHG